jgi:5-methylthioadenosine/S-adenosylhomocysteine deaminase
VSADGAEATPGLAVEGAILAGERVGLRAEQGRIVELGPGVAARAGDRRIDGAGKALVPGLINGHTHAAMTLFRGYADDLPLMTWLTEHIWPAEAKLTADDVYWGTRLACAEMIRSGTVGFWDMYWQPGATARAVADAGLRARIGAPLIDGADPSGTPKLQDDAARGLEELAGSGPMIAPAFAPHAVYTVSEPSLSWLAEHSANTGIPIHIHLSETEGEVNDCIAKHGVRPAEYLHRLGVLGPRTLLAHSVWLDDHERGLIADAGATVVTNPNANMKLAVGEIFDMPAARKAGIPVALGTDGAGSNNSLDLFGEVKQLALVQKQRSGDAAAVTAEQAWAVATGATAPLLGATPELEVGGAADFLLVDLETPALALGSLEAGLVYAADASVVDTTVVAGEVLLENGEPSAGDLDEVIAKARESAQRLGLA